MPGGFAYFFFFCFFFHPFNDHPPVVLSADRGRRGAKGQAWITRMWHFLAMKKSMSH